MRTANRTFLTTEQVGRMLEKSPEWVRRAIAARKIAAVNVSVGDGRPTWRVPADALEDWLAARSTVPQAAAPPRRRRATEGVVEYF